jgi:hypothetical protein
MSEGSKAREIDLGDGFGEVAVKVNSARVEIHADGSIDAFTAGPVNLHPAANDSGGLAGKGAIVEDPGRADPQIGDEMKDGTIYAGMSPDTDKAMYATPADAPLTYTFDQAQRYASMLDAHGHKDWRVPTKGELNVLYNNRAAIGGFDTSGSYPGGLYRSSSQNLDKPAWQRPDQTAWSQCFSDGWANDNSYKSNELSLRCVRG